MSILAGEISKSAAVGFDALLCKTSVKVQGQILQVLQVLHVLQVLYSRPKVGTGETWLLWVLAFQLTTSFKGPRFEDRFRFSSF